MIWVTWSRDSDPSGLDFSTSSAPLSLRKVESWCANGQHTIQWKYEIATDLLSILCAPSVTDDMLEPNLVEDCSSLSSGRCRLRVVHRGNTACHGFDIINNKAEQYKF